MAEKTTHSDFITIGRLSSLAQIGADTVRFYESSGLLEAQERTPSGYRLYSRNSLARVQFIRRARETGYSLDQIKEILQLHDQGGPKSEVQDFTASMVADVDQKIRALGKWRQLFTDVSEYLQQTDADHIDAETVDMLMRSQCNMLSPRNE